MQSWVVFPSSLDVSRSSLSQVSVSGHENQYSCWPLSERLPTINTTVLDTQAHCILSSSCFPAIHTYIHTYTRMYTTTKRHCTQPEYIILTNVRRRSYHVMSFRLTIAPFPTLCSSRTLTLMVRIKRYKHMCILHNNASL